MRSVFRSKFKITQAFGVNKDYYSKFGLTAHEGIDLIPTGTVWDVLCLADGVVVKDEDNPRSGAYGVNVTVWHNTLKKATQYCHPKENYVQNGQKVKTGDKIGLMGATGNVTGAHLHLNLFETDDNGYRLNKNNGFLGGVDPLPFLNEETGPPDTTALDECRRQVDREIQSKEETYNELVDTRSDLDAEKRKNEFYENVIKQYSNILGVPPDTADIAGAMQKLVGNEDTIQKLNREKDDLNRSITESNNLYAELKEEHQSTLKEKQAVSEALQRATDKNKEWEGLYGKLEKAYEGLKEDQQYDFVHLVFGLYYRVKKGGE